MNNVNHFSHNGAEGNTVWFSFERLERIFKIFHAKPQPMPLNNRVRKLVSRFVIYPSMNTCSTFHVLAIQTEPQSALRS